MGEDINKLLLRDASLYEGTKLDSSLVGCLAMYLKLASSPAEEQRRGYEPSCRMDLPEVDALSVPARTLVR